MTRLLLIAVLFLSLLFFSLHGGSISAYPGNFSIISASPGCSGANPQVTLSWSSAGNVYPNSNPTGDQYQIFRTPAGVNPIATILAPGQLQYIDTSVSAGVAYTYTVRAVDAVYPATPYGSLDSAPVAVTAPSCDSTPPTVFYNSMFGRCYKPSDYPSTISITAYDQPGGSGVQSVTLRLTNLSVNPGTNNTLRSASPAGGSTWNYDLKNSDLSAVGGTSNIYKLELQARDAAGNSTPFATGPTPNGAYCPAGSDATCAMFKYDNQCIPPAAGTSGGGGVHSNRGL